MKHYFQNGENRAIAQLQCFKDLDIPINQATIPPMYRQKPDALARFSQRVSALNHRFSSDDITSLEIFVQSIKDNSPDDLMEFISENDTLIFYYAPFEAKAIAHQIVTFHIDSTYKLLRSKLPFYALTGKYKEMHGFPFLYFFVQPDKSENIQICLVRFFEWCHLEPQYISMDCAPQIAEAVENGIPACHILWCGVHVLRAILSHTEMAHQKGDIFWRQ
ncbi:hypothetical protein TVAG_532900 [Trichomonas vaginalis G3]|uniref:MULE transposase domain-containing protein n=1 Tax=Trichomonas vaginalis (strain ATCC PRA-98 / G3) TaxID=412133 RepID=A2H594_TRIV3|nr:hypothetical protein TVAG_532900 [Trichomonas vaginalis G3]|eukprot:XP_001288353.1 hypothetical protein [Trichomonas vaginalis G3]